MGDKPKRNVSSLKKRNEEIIKSAEPHLDQGEEVRALFVGQTLLSPIWYLLLFPLLILLSPLILLVFLIGLIVPPVASLLPLKRVILVTDRSVNFCSKQRGRFGVKDVLHTAPLGKISAEPGFTWSLKVGDWPRLYASELGIRGERAEVATLIAQTAEAPEAAGLRE